MKTIPIIDMSRLQYYTCVVLFITMLLFSLSCQQNSKPALSRLDDQETWEEKTFECDLSNCTHAEIRYNPSLLGFWGWGSEVNKKSSFLNAREKAELQQSETIVIRDKQYIGKFSELIERARYFRTGGAIATKWVMFIEFYEDDVVLERLTVVDDIICNKSHEWYDVPREMARELVRVPQVLPYIIREECGHNLRDLHKEFRRYFRDNDQYPACEAWCQAVLESLKWDTRLDEFMSPFLCPGVHASHYAMNQNCTAESPPDVVLLFESSVGWNQHGGPELFTVENHDPKGGYVLFNDGRTKFIRTQDELEQLQWK